MLPLTLPILRLLADGEFHSGEHIAAKLGVSRASICNALQDSAFLGVHLHKIRGRGYQLSTPIEWLELEQIYAHRGNQVAKIPIQILDVVESTNTLLMQTAAQNSNASRCVVAEIQTQGRGRRGRVWHATLGGSLTFSVLWQFNVGVSQLSGLSLAVGVALARALTEIGIPDIQLKWPNDLMHGYHKLGGVLIELQGDALGPSTTVIGVGLNIRLPEIVKNRIDQAVVDVFSLKPEGVSRNQLLGITLRHLQNIFIEFETHGFGRMRDEWQKLHAYQSKSVALRMPDGAEVLGVVRGVSTEGALILETSSGERRFGSGEISMRAAAQLNPLLKRA